MVKIIIRKKPKKRIIRKKSRGIRRGKTPLPGTRFVKRKSTRA